ncbi:MAG TPA: hypothetical protein VK879_01790 [Candidatus Sulfomarinibacteraceae bacterium]|nr:hypothetical protein [Candidatus Sulfomarinibacteraceae bacterium]
MSRIRRGCGLFFMGWIFIGAGLLALYVFGQQYTLSCSRLEMENPDCVREARWLGLIQTGERTIESLSGASVGESCDEDGCTYRVNLHAAEGQVPLSGFYSSGRSEKERQAQRINDFVAETDIKTFELETERSIWIVLFTGIFILVGLGLILSAPFSLLRGG